MRIARLVMLTSLAVGGCAEKPKPVVPEYPVIVDKAAPQLTLKVASRATKLSLPCAPQEAEVDNGLDDDCDGTVDGIALEPRRALLVTLAHGSQVDLKLVITPEPPSVAPVQDVARERVCDGSAAFATQRLEVNLLDQGRYTLSLVRVDGCGADQPASVNASIWLYGRAQGAYGVSLKPGESLVLGTLDAT